MSKYPDNWTVALIFTPGTEPLLALPALPGVSHALTSVELEVAAAVASATINMQLAAYLDGRVDYVFGWTLIYGGNHDSMSWSGLIVAAPGKGVSLNPGSVLPANWYASLRVSGYLV